MSAVRFVRRDRSTCGMRYGGTAPLRTPSLASAISWAASWPRCSCATDNHLLRDNTGLHLTPTPREADFPPYRLSSVNLRHGISVRSDGTTIWQPDGIAPVRAVNMSSATNSGTAATAYSQRKDLFLLITVTGAVHAECSQPLHAIVSSGRDHKCNTDWQVRPRGWHLWEKHLVVDGRPVPGGIFDFALYFFHNVKAAKAAGTGPYFYLPKMQSHLEARLWNDVFLDAQARGLWCSAMITENL